MADDKIHTIPTSLPELVPADGIDFEAAFNSRDWLRQALEARGAKVVGGGAGVGGADLDIVLEGMAFNVRIAPQ